jgi:hypothetical protein
MTWCSTMAPFYSLNTTIPQRDAWKALACPRCGGRYYKDGKFHTVQRGWQ